MYAWVRDQMPDRETRAFFSDFHAAPARSSNQLVGSQSIVVNRMQAKLFLLDPVYWEIATFLSAHSDQNKHPTLSELSKVFKIPARQMRKYLDELFEYGIVDRAMKAEMEYFSKLWLFIPYEDEYRPLREMNFRHAAQKFLHDDSPSKFRTTITRFLTPVQMKELEAAVLALTNHIIDLPDDGIPKDAELCTVGVFSSVRKFGNA